MGGDQQRPPRPGRGAHRVGQDPLRFPWALDRLAARPLPEDRKARCRVLYVSPMKALAVDVERNLRSPLVGSSTPPPGSGCPSPTSPSRCAGHTPADERRAFARTPTDVLITTPESLFLILTSAAREALTGVETVILDEVHALAGTKRGAHLALSLERLDAHLERPAQRIGLSATVRPVEEVARYLAGGRPVDVGSRRRPSGGTSGSSCRCPTWAARRSPPATCPARRPGPSSAPRSGRTSRSASSTSSPSTPPPWSSPTAAGSRSGSPPGSTRSGRNGSRPPRVPPRSVHRMPCRAPPHSPAAPPR